MPAFLRLLNSSRTSRHRWRAAAENACGVSHISNCNPTIAGRDRAPRHPNERQPRAISQHGDQREQAKQRQRGAQDRKVLAPPPSLYAEMGHGAEPSG